MVNLMMNLIKTYSYDECHCIEKSCCVLVFNYTVYHYCIYSLSPHKTGMGNLKATGLCTAMRTVLCGRASTWPWIETSLFSVVYRNGWCTRLKCSPTMTWETVHLVLSSKKGLEMPVSNVVYLNLWMRTCINRVSLFFRYHILFCTFNIFLLVDITCTWNYLAWPVCNSLISYWQPFVFLLRTKCWTRVCRL